MEIIKLNTTEAVEKAKQRVESIADTSRIRVLSQPTFEQARAKRIEVKGIKNQVNEKKESITKPLNEALKNVRSLFRPIEDKLKLIDDYLKSQVLTYNSKLIAEKEQREKEAEKKVEKGETIEKATKGLTKTNEKLEVIKTRKLKKVRIIDESKLPREYLIPDEQKIKAALLSGIKVEGAELYEETIAVNL